RFSLTRHRSGWNTPDFACPTHNLWVFSGTRFASCRAMSSSPAAEWEEPAEAHAGEVRKLSTLLEASQALSATLDLKASLQRVLEILGRHHGAIRSTVVLLNENSGDVELEAAFGVTAKRVRYRVGEGITGTVVQTGKPMVVPRVSREPMFLSRA